MTVRPNLFVVGFPKCGTTSLFHYLDQHPELQGSVDKEPQYLLPTVAGDEPGPEGAYLAQWPTRPRSLPARYRFEATPGYVYGGERTIAAMRTVGEPERVVVILRDPVTRLRSAREFLQSRLLLPADIGHAEFVERNLVTLRAGTWDPAGRDADAVLLASRYADHLAPWVEAFGERLYVAFTESLGRDPLGVVQRLLAWLEVDPEPAATFDLSNHNRSVAPKTVALFKLALLVNDRFSGFWRRHPRMEAAAKSAYHRVNGRSAQRGAEWDDLEAQVRTAMEPFLVPLPAVLAGATVDPDLPDWYVALREVTVA